MNWAVQCDANCVPWSPSPRCINWSRRSKGASTSTVDVVRNAFPLTASMTGSPKRRTCEILDDLEGRARGCYAGCLGFFGFDGSADLNVVIRTAVLSGLNLEAALGRGGGRRFDGVIGHGGRVERGRPQGEGSARTTRVGGTPRGARGAARLMMPRRGAQYWYVAFLHTIASSTATVERSAPRTPPEPPSCGVADQHPPWPGRSALGSRKTQHTRAPLPMAAGRRVIHLGALAPGSAVCFASQNSPPTRIAVPRSTTPALRPKSSWNSVERRHTSPGGIASRCPIRRSSEKVRNARQPLSCFLHDHRQQIRRPQTGP